MTGFRVSKKIGGNHRKTKTISKTRETEKRTDARFPKQLISEELMTLCQRKMNLIEEMKQEREIDNAQMNLEDLPEDLNSINNGYTTDNSTMKFSNSSKKTKKSVDSSNDSQESRERTRPKGKSESKVSVRDLDEEFAVQLTETPCWVVFHKPSFVGCYEDETEKEEAQTTANNYIKFLEERSGSDIFVTRGSQTFEPRCIERSTMTEEPDTIEFGCDAYDFRIKEEMQNEEKSKLEMLEESFLAQIHEELYSHQKSPFFKVPEDLSSIKFFDYIEIPTKNSRTRMGNKGNNKRTNKEMNVSIHNSNWKESNSFSKKFTDTIPLRKKNLSRGTISGKEMVTLQLGPTTSDFNDHIELEMKRFGQELLSEKVDLIISEEEYKVELISWSRTRSSSTI